MENKYTKYLQLPLFIKQFDVSNSLENKLTFESSKWVSYFLLITGIILWVTFNIVVIEYQQFPPYILVIMNIILYCIVAVMASPDHYSETKANSFQKQKEVCK